MIESRKREGEREREREREERGGGKGRLRGGSTGPVPKKLRKRSSKL